MSSGPDGDGVDDGFWDEAEDRPTAIAMRTVVACSLASAVCVLGAMGIFVQRATEAEKERNRTFEEERIDRAVEACLQENIQTEQTRRFLHEQVVTLAINFFDTTGRDVVELRNGNALAVYDDFVAESFPYRDCSESCVEAYFSDQPDCPPPDMILSTGEHE